MVAMAFPVPETHPESLRQTSIEGRPCTNCGSRVSNRRELRTTAAWLDAAGKSLLWLRRERTRWPAGQRSYIGSEPQGQAFLMLVSRPAGHLG